MARPWGADDNNGVCHAHYVTTEGPLWLCPLVPPCWDRPKAQQDSGVTEGEDMVAGKVLLTGGRWRLCARFVVQSKSLVHA